ncbi:t-box transcription factor TBX18 [Trichonephila clavipes]|nr:t-box transcription factor TBX18 [Trichonephila clavipes]
MLSERAEAFSVAALLGIRNPTLTDYSQESSSEYILQVEDKNETENKIEMELISSELWSQFHKLQNEMIITKSGRRIFPTLKALAKGLDPNRDYIIWIDIVPVDQLRYRYVYRSSQWIVAGSGEKHNSNSTYIHPDSPSSGKYWMSKIIIFDKVKLTNSKELKSKEQISLLSMHKYQPRFHIQKVIDSSKNSFPKISSSKSLTFTFPETQFLTVTAYQNQQGESYKFFVRKALAQLSKQWIPVLQRHRRSWSLLSFGSNLYPPPSKSLFFRALLSSPKKTFLNTRADPHHAPSHWQATKPALGLPSPIRAEHTNTLLGRLKSNGARILVQHLDTLVHHNPSFLKAILLTSAKATMCFLYRLRLLSMG